jgi:hypothetical protein
MLEETPGFKMSHLPHELPQLSHRRLLRVRRRPPILYGRQLDLAVGRPQLLVLLRQPKPLALLVRKLVTQQVSGPALLQALGQHQLHLLPQRCHRTRERGRCRHQARPVGGRKLGQEELGLLVPLAQLVAGVAEVMLHRQQLPREVGFPLTRRGELLPRAGQLILHLRLALLGIRQPGAQLVELDRSD